MSDTERKLRDALRKIGFAVMETSGEWSIHGVREHDKRMDAEDFATINWAMRLELENERFRRDVDALLNGTVRTSGEARSRLVEMIRQPSPKRQAPRLEQPT